MDKHKIPKISTLLYFIKPYPKYIALMFLLILAAAVFEGVNIIVLFGLLGTVLDPGSVPAADGNFILSFFSGLVQAIPIQNKIVAISVFMILVTIIKSFLVFARQIFTYHAGYKIWFDVQKKIFEKYMNADYQYFLDHKQGEMIFRAFSAPSVMGGVLQYAGEALALTTQLVMVGIVLVSISPGVSAIVFLFGGVFYFLTNFIAKKVSYNLGRKRTEACEEQNNLLVEFISGIKQIKVFMSETRWASEYVKAMKSYFRPAIKDRVWHEIPINAVEIFAIVMLCGLIIVFKRIQGEAFLSQLSLLGTFAYAFYRFMPSLKKIGSLRIGILGNLPIVEALYSVAREKMKTIPDGDVCMGEFNEAIEFREINFAYPGRTKTLENINFSVKKGEVTAFVGSSGSGKTTVMNLLLRVFAPTEGKILIDGRDIKDLKLDSWLKNVGYVSQETFIFNASIENNIVFGRERDPSRVVEVCKMANAHEFIENFPDGYQTRVGERGLKLSGGQRQRLAIARAIYSSPQVLIMDEATSALDNVSEAKVRDAIKKVSHDHTVILIAHRLSTVVHADQIMVLDQGRIVEKGTHEMLKTGSEIYSELYRGEKVAG